MGNNIKLKNKPLEKIKNSEKNLKRGGKPILKIITKNHQKLNNGIKKLIEPIKFMFRVKSR